MNRTSLRIMAAVVLLLIATLNSAVATTYKLVKVTSVEAGKMYVFEQDGKVMKNTISNGGLQVSTTHKETGLSFDEIYVWTLEDAGNNTFKMKNSSGSYLQLVSLTSADLQFSSSFTSWSFHLIDTNTFIIECSSNDATNRFLGYNSNKNFYKAYKHGDYDHTTPYSITVYQLVEETSEDVTLTAAGMATYVSTHDLDYGNVEGLKAYRAKFDGYEITFTSVTQVPANQGVLLKAAEELTASTIYTVPFAAETVTPWADDYNDFIPGAGANVPSVAEGHYNYILNNVGGVVGFYRANNKKVATNRAYLSTMTPPPSTAEAFGLIFEDETTGVGSLIPALSESEVVVYDLQGRRVIQPTKGLYIVGGHKIILK